MRSRIRRVSLLFLAFGMLTLSVCHEAGQRSQVQGSRGPDAQAYGQPRLVMQLGHWGVVVSVAFSPDGRRVLTGSYDFTAKLWDSKTGQELRTFAGHSSIVRSVAFSPDGRQVLTGSEDKTAKLWDAESGREIRSLVSFTDGTWAVVDPSGRYDASNAGDVDWLHWVVGYTPVALSQLKERYYEPGLLAKVMGFNKEQRRSMESFAAPKVYPGV